MHEPQPIAAAHRELDGASSAAPGAPVADTPDSPDSPDSISALSDAARAVYAAWGASQVKLGLATYAEHRKFRTLKLNSVLSDTFGLQPIGAGCRLRFPGRTDEWMTFLPWAHALADAAAGRIYLFIQESNGAVAALGLSCRSSFLAKLRELQAAATSTQSDFKMRIGDILLNIEFRGTPQEASS